MNEFRDYFDATNNDDVLFSPQEIIMETQLSVALVKIFLQIIA